jgi:NAD(P)-dependent dehydrogenase (short-subunit alcohol dehydrogenase family)
MEAKFARAAARDDLRQRRTAAAQLSWTGTAIRFALPLPLAAAFLFRAVDGLIFEPALNEAGLPPHALLGLIMATWVSLSLLSVSRPSVALALAATALGTLKQRVDGGVLKPPAVSPTAPVVALVTGASSGIGREVAAELARQGHTVVMGCRSAARCSAARVEILARLDVPGSRLVIPPDAPLDLARLSTAARFASATGEATGGAAIELLVLNAGFVPLGSGGSGRSGESGLEEGLYAMYYGHQALVRGLASLHLLGPSATAVVVSSDAMRFGGFDGSLETGSGARGSRDRDRQPRVRRESSVSSEAVLGRGGGLAGGYESIVTEGRCRPQARAISRAR